jgi:NAD(P)-dependent dehydrogenase (short-subunit alcohol dehydrogenase family)
MILMAESQQVALVTGAAGNVGRAVAEVLAARGVQIAAIDRSGGPLQAMVGALPDPARHLVIADLDLTDPAGCQAAVARVLARYGRLDMVAHTVGTFAAAPLAEATPAMWEQMFRVNLMTTANIYSAAIEPMRAARRGSLAAIGAAAALKAPAGFAAYAAAKSGVLRLTESLSEELKAAGVRVNAVLPGTIDTPQNRAAMPDADPDLWVRPSQVAEAIAFLLSDAASGISGALLPVTGFG